MIKPKVLRDAAQFHGVQFPNFVIKAKIIECRLYTNQFRDISLTVPNENVSRNVTWDFAIRP